MSPAVGEPAPSSASDAEVYGKDFFYTFSRTPTELPADSALRHELFDSIRKSIPPDHQFEGSLQVYRNWAFFRGVTVDAAGKTFYDPESGGSSSAALWLRTKDGSKEVWKLVDSVMAAPFDTPYRFWPYRYGAPSLLLGMNPALDPSRTSSFP